MTPTDPGQTFLAYLMRHVDLDEPIGDLARDTSLDTCLWEPDRPFPSTWRALYEHVARVHNGDPLALRAVVDAARRRYTATHARQNRAGWIACTVCPAFADGSPRHHAESARSPRARKHLAAMRGRDGTPSIDPAIRPGS